MVKMVFTSAPGYNNLKLLFLVQVEDLNDVTPTFDQPFYTWSMSVDDPSPVWERDVRVNYFDVLACLEAHLNDVRLTHEVVGDHCGAETFLIYPIATFHCSRM